METDSKNDFLIKLEEIALNLEEEIDKYSEEDEIYRYFNDLIKMIERNKMDFVQGVTESNKHQKDELINKLKVIGLRDFEIESLLDEINNLYNLATANLLDNIDVSSQREKSMQVIEEVKDKMQNYIEKIDYITNEKKKKANETHLEQIVSLGTKFDDNRLEDAIDDIDFFNRTMDEMNLSIAEKYDLVLMLLEENVKFYKRKVLEAREEKKVIENLNIEDLDDLDESALNKLLFQEEVSDTKEQELNKMFDDEEIEVLSFTK